MRYIALDGTGHFRTFKGILNGKTPYVPEKIPLIDPDILSEKDFFLRFQELLNPYFDNDPQLKNILPKISPDLGSLQTIDNQFAFWQPKYHFSDLSFSLLANIFEEYAPQYLKKPLNLIGTTTNTGFSFCRAFPLEQKNIFLPETVFSIPESNELTNIFQVNTDPKTWHTTKNTFLKEVPVRLDSSNFIIILGYMGLIIHALHETERKRLRFYNDPVDIAVPADNLEYLLAAYYLSISPLPIRKIIALSSEHRTVHTLLSRGIFNLDTMQDSAFFLSLYRLLFEISRGSIEKVTLWAKELAQTKTFKIDAKSFDKMQKIFLSGFISKRKLTDVQEVFTNLGLNSSIFSQAAYAFSRETGIFTLSFEPYNNQIESSSIAKMINTQDMLQYVTQ